MKIEDAKFVVLDFETVTPKGRPPEPIEVAALLVGPGLIPDRNTIVDCLIKPPEDAPITSFDTAQTGIRPADVENCPDAQEVLRVLEKFCNGAPPIVVAQNARYEAAIVRRFSSSCPLFARCNFIDTVSLGKMILPHRPDYKLDSLARALAVDIPANRHRALPDVEVTAEVFIKLTRKGLSLLKWDSTNDLIQSAGVVLKQEKPRPSEQISLF